MGFWRPVRSVPTRRQNRGCTAQSALGGVRPVGQPDRGLARQHAVAVGPLATRTTPGGRARAVPKFVTQCQPPGRAKCSTSASSVATHSSASAVCSCAPQPQRLAVELQRRPRVGAPAPATAVGEKPAGCGSQRVAVAEPVRRRPSPSTAAAPGSRRGPSWCSGAQPDRVLQRRRPAGRRPRAGRAPRPGRGRPSRAAPASTGSPRGPGAGRRPRPAPGSAPSLISHSSRSVPVRQPVAGGVPDDVVVGQHPGRRRAGLLRLVQADGDHVAELARRRSRPSAGRS